MRRWRPDEELFYREPGPDRPMLSANDWYGAGFINGMCGTQPRGEQRVRWYCGRQGAYEQFRLGSREARRVREGSEAPLLDETGPGDCA